MLTIDEIKDFFKLENSHAKKELGQNFLINLKVCEDICDALNINDNDKVLEIGPGLGSLTDILIDKTKNLTCVEYDNKFYNFLNKCYENRGINIVKSNILHFKDYSMNKIIGNLPYYITTDILEFIMLNYKNLDLGVFMIQNEALKRLTAKSGKDFNAINVLIDYKYKLTPLFLVKKNNFFPVPNVDSIVFKMDNDKEKSLDFALSLYKVAKILFSNRRKTIGNNLKSLIKDTNSIEEILNSIDLTQSLRAENLKTEDFVNLTQILLNKGIIR